MAAILNPTLGDNGGLTRTHALVTGSPATDAVAAACATANGQRGFIRPKDSDADTVAGCDIGAFELALPAVETVAADPNPQSRCTRSRCDIRIKCNVDQALGTPCTNQIRFFVRERDVRLSAASSPNQGVTEAASTRAPRRIRFAFGVANVPPGETANVRLGSPSGPSRSSGPARAGGYGASWRSETLPAPAS
ncbi:MAG: choice-of-anchor Q domain-containing protein [Gammaproteobacteria bacterium]